MYIIRNRFILKYLFDFIFNEILENLEKDKVDFLLKTSLLPCFNYELANKIDAGNYYNLKPLLNLYVKTGNAKVKDFKQIFQINADEAAGFVKKLQKLKVFFIILKFNRFLI